jgi:adenosylcobyric acid synthase
VSDLAWLRSTGLAAALVARAAVGGLVLGICGGYQMLARTITDDVESRAGVVDGLALLPTDVTFARAKTLGRPSTSALGETVQGYEIHHGQVRVDGGADFVAGCQVGPVYGTSWHGIFENDGFRRAFLRMVATHAGREFVGAPDVSFAAVRERRMDALGDLVADHLDTDALWRLIEGGAPELPVVHFDLHP